MDWFLLSHVSLVTPDDLIPGIAYTGIPSHITNFRVMQTPGTMKA
jgi:hypothetical protein